MSKREILRTSKITAYAFEEAEAHVKELIEQAKQAASRAYAPYSNFQVGAAVLLSNGLIVQGNNQENAAYPSGLCAERVACFSAMANNPEASIEMIAIVAKHGGTNHYKLATPCGSCRQSMSEYENKQDQPIRLYLLGEDDQVYESESVENLLPFKFSDQNLKTEDGV